MPKCRLVVLPSLFTLYLLLASTLFFVCHYINRAENLHQTFNFIDAIWNIVVATERIL